MHRDVVDLRAGNDARPMRNRRRHLAHIRRGDHGADARSRAGRAHRNRFSPVAYAGHGHSHTGHRAATAHSGAGVMSRHSLTCGHIHPRHRRHIHPGHRPHAHIGHRAQRARIHRRNRCAHADTRSQAFRAHSRCDPPPARRSCKRAPAAARSHHRFGDRNSEFVDRDRFDVVAVGLHHGHRQIGNAHVEDGHR